MKLGAGLPGRSPDILFVANENLHRMRDGYLDGPADLVIGVISPGSRKVDKEEKFREYERGGVSEYWIIDPKRKEAEFYQLGPQGTYQRVPVGEDGIYRSGILNGFWLRVGWLWQNPLPPLRDVLKEWGMA